MINFILTLLRKYPVLQQLIRFGVVGTTSAAVNLFLVILLVELLNLHPLIANIFAFAIAFNVSYIGHYYWSFAAEHTRHKASIPRFLLVAITSFALNEGLFFVFLSIFHLYYILALFIVLLIVPLFTFTLSKFWAFG